MNRYLFISFLLVVFLAPSPGRAQSWPELSKKLYQRCLEFNDAVKDLTLFMKMKNPSTEGTIVTEAKLYQKHNKFRSEITLEGLEGEGDEELRTIIIDDGTAVWILNPALGKSQLPPSEGSKYRGQWYCSDYLPAKGEVLGSEKIEGKDCLIIGVLDEDTDFDRLWIDKQSLLIVKLASESEDQDSTFTLFSDYRKVVGDFEVPFRIDVYAGDDLISTTVVDSVVVNTGLEDDLFNAERGISDTPSESGKKVKDALNKPKR